MLADSFVYGLALLAVGASVLRKKQVAKWSGYLQAALAIIGLLEVLRRFLGLEAPPDYEIMIVVATLALLANVTCLYLLKRSQDEDAHIQASMIFTSNDIWINAGVVVAAVLVLWSDSNLPDLLIGLIVFSIVIRGAFRILKIAK
jgi:Co/Zn/Cd efflux system component